MTFFVDNADPVGHTFTIDGLGVDACSLEGHDQMLGTLVVD